MDGVFGGLAGAVRIVPMGREDIPVAERPGTALVGLAREAHAAGAFAVDPGPDEDALPHDPGGDWEDEGDPDPPVPEEDADDAHLPDGPEG